MDPSLTLYSTGPLDLRWTQVTRLPSGNTKAGDTPPNPLRTHPQRIIETDGIPRPRIEPPEAFPRLDVNERGTANIRYLQLEPCGPDLPIAVHVQRPHPVIAPETSTNGLDDLSGEHPTSAELHPSTGASKENLGLPVYGVKDSTGGDRCVIIPYAGVFPLWAYEIVRGKDHEVGRVIHSNHGGRKPCVVLGSKRLVRTFNVVDAELLEQGDVLHVTDRDHGTDPPKDPQV